MRQNNNSLATIRPLRLLALAGATSLVLTACAGGGDSFDSSDASAGGNAVPGEGRLVIAQSADILTMDPHMHRNRTTQNVIRNVFEGLVNQDENLEAIPELATEWEQTDPLTWRFSLRENVTFHNGEPFNAEAVKYSLERILDPKQKSPRASMLSTIDSVEVEDEFTVLIKTTEPSPTLIAGLAVNEIVPPKYIDEVGDEGFAKAPVGTGPFTFDEWVTNERVVLKANADHWDGAPTINELIFRPIPEVAARMAALGSGDVQIVAEVPPDLADGLGSDARIETVSGTRIYFLAMNVQKPPFDSQEARVAANEAVDKDTIVDALYQGYARPLNQPAFPEMIGYDEEFEGYDFDLDAAKSVFSNVDTPVEIDVEESDRTLAQAVAGQLQTAGLDVKVNALETQAWSDKVESGGSAAYLSSWGVAEGDADVIFARHFWTPVREEAVYTDYTNPAVDDLIVDARTTSDVAERESLYADAIEQVMADAPWVPILNPEEIYGVSNSVQGWDPSPIGRFNVTDVTVGE